MLGTDKLWHKAPKGRVWEIVQENVSSIENEQSSIYDRFVKLAALYNPLDAPMLDGFGVQSGYSADSLGIVTENVVASNIDTVVAAIAVTDVRARFMTDDADWHAQRRARHLEWYAEGLATKLGIHEKCQQAFKMAALKGTGLIKVHLVGGQIRVEPVMIDDVIVNEAEVSNGRVRQMHQRTWNAHKDDLSARFPGSREQIERVSASRSLRWANINRRSDDTLIATIESWYLPIGIKDSDFYVPGRHVLAIDGHDLLDEEWSDEGFPFAEVRWSKKDGGWYGISLAERIAGHQRMLNKHNWQTDRILQQWAVPTTYVRVADANLAVKTTSRLGTIAPYKGDLPQTVIPPAISPEVYNRAEKIKASAYEESGVSRMAAQSVKPAGLDSGVALREYRDQTTQRFGPQEKAFERLVLDAVWLALGCCKKLGAKAPTIQRASRFGARKIAWREVDMGEVRVQIAAASSLSRTPAGRIQSVLEWAQAGVISQDETRRLLRHPDLERSMSIFTAALENIEYCFDEIADGNPVVPEPFMNLKLAVARGQMEYLNWLMDGAPEDRLEMLRQFVVLAVELNKRAAPANDMAAVPGSGAMPPGGEMPMDAPPQAALAAQAMQLKSA